MRCQITLLLAIANLLSLVTGLLAGLGPRKIISSSPSMTASMVPSMAPSMAPSEMDECDLCSDEDECDICSDDEDECDICSDDEDECDICSDDEPTKGATTGAPTTGPVPAPVAAPVAAPTTGPVEPPSDPPGGTINGDPHLSFAHGGRADFRGSDGGIYALLSTSRLALNGAISFSKFKMWNLLVSGSFFTEMFWVLSSRTTNTRVRFEFAPNDLPAMLHLPYGSRPFLAGQSFDFEDISIKVEHVGGDVGSTRREMAIVKTAGWIMKATAKPILRSVEAGKLQIDVDLKPVGDPLAGGSSPHGLLGQSWDGDTVAVNGKMDSLSEMKKSALKVVDAVHKNTYLAVETSAQAEGAIEGVGSEYIVGESFATEFKYSRFGKKGGAVPRDASKLGGPKKDMGAKASQSASTSGDDVVFDDTPTTASH